MFLRLGLRDGLADRGVRVRHGPERRGLDGREFWPVPALRSGVGPRLPRLLGAVGPRRMEHGERVDYLRAGGLFVGTVGL